MVEYQKRNVILCLKNQNRVNTAKPNQNENFIYRVMIVLVIGALAVFLLGGVNQYYTYTQYMNTIRSAAGWVGLLGLVLGIAGLIGAAATGKKALVWAGGLLVLLGLCAGSAFFFYTEGIAMSYALIIGSCVLYILSKIYTPEYVALTGISLLAGVGYYAMSEYGGSQMINSYTLPAIITVAAVLVLGVAVTFLAGRGEGTVRFGKWSIQLWQSKPLSCCCIWPASSGRRCCCSPSCWAPTFAWYCVWVVCATIFALTVWFTIKLM